MPTRTFWLLLFALVAVGVVVRCTWLLRVGWELAAIQWNGVPMLTSADGYWFAAGAGELLSGAWQGHPRLPHAWDHAIVAVTWLLAEILPVGLERILLYLPALLAPFVAMPIALIGRELGLSRVGLAATALAVLAPVYVSRSSAGYYDTDAFALLPPLVAALHLVRLIRRARRRDALAASFWLGVYPFAYASAAPLGFALASFGCAGLVIAHRRRMSTPPRRTSSPEDELGAVPPDRHGVVVSLATSLLMLVLSQVPLWWPARLALIMAAYLVAPRVLARLPPLPRTHSVRALAGAMALGLTLVATVGLRLWEAVPAKLEAMLGAGRVAWSQSQGDPTGSNTVMESVAEAQPQALGAFVERTVGSWPALGIALLGVVALFAIHPATLVLLPLAALGAFAFVAGSRFAMYAVPVLSLGLGFGLAALARLIRSSRLGGAVFGAATVACAAPVALFDWRAIPTTALIAPEVEALEALDRASTPADNTVAWWDYGYPIVFHGKTRVLVDGGRQDPDSALVAEILLASNPARSARLARLATELQEELRDKDWAIAPTLFQRAAERGLTRRALLDHLARAAEPPDLPHPTRDTFLYLPARLLALIPTVARYRPEDPGRATGPGYYRLWQGTVADGTRLLLGPGVHLDAHSLTLTEGEVTRPLEALYSTAGAGAELEVRQATRHPGAPTSGIYLHDHAIFIELDRSLLSSTAIQLLVFERADPTFFEPVFANVAAKVFRVRR